MVRNCAQPASLMPLARCGLRTTDWRPAVFWIERVVLADQLEGDHLVEVARLPPHLLVSLGRQLSGASAAIAALLAASESFLGFGGLLLRLAIVKGFATASLAP